MTTTTRPMTDQEASRYAWLQQRWADHPDLLAEIDADMHRQLSRPAPPPCPAWCTEEFHDGYDDLTDDPNGRQVRSHTVRVSPTVFLMAEEFRDADDTVTAGKVEIVIEEETSTVPLNGQDALALADALRLAAHKLDEIAGGADCTTTTTPSRSAAGRYVELTDVGDEIGFHRPPGLSDDTWRWIAESMNATWHAGMVHLDSADLAVGDQRSRA